MSYREQTAAYVLVRKWNENVGNDIERFDKNENYEYVQMRDGMTHEK